MRTTLAAVLSLSLLAGCGSDDSPPPPVFGGFEPIEQAALIFAPATCDIPFLGPTAVAGVGIAFTDYAGACDVLAQTQFCGTRGSSSTVLAVAISGLVGGTTTVFAGPGTYPYLARPPTGAFMASTADAGQVDAACEPIPVGADLDATGGRIVLASVTGTALTGTIDFRFDDGTAFQHDIDATVCDLSIDVCGIFQPCFEYVCVPPPP